MHFHLFLTFLSLYETTPVYGALVHRPWFFLGVIKTLPEQVMVNCAQGRSRSATFAIAAWWLLEVLGGCLMTGRPVAFWCFHLRSFFGVPFFFGCWEVFCCLFGWCWL